MIREVALKKTIGLYSAVTLAMGIVIGAGMFSLPGLVYQEAGGWAIFSWLLDGLMVLPLLFIFAALGARFPSAGGGAGFVGQAFPSLKIGCSYLLLGTFTLGIPGIAITGAGYVVIALGIAEARRQVAIATLAFVFILSALVIAWFGGKLASSVQNIVVTLLIVCLVLVIALSIPSWGQINISVGEPTWSNLWHGMGLAFFAYTGWELLAFIAEEFKAPQRDFPLAVSISYILVLCLYIGSALAVQAIVALDDPLLLQAPFLAVIQGTIGRGIAIPLLALVVLAIIVTNLNGAIWAASRLVFDLGRNGWMPRAWALQYLDGPQATPRRAVFFIGLLFTLVLIAYSLSLLNLADLLKTAGQNFFVLYTLSIIAYIKVESSIRRKFFGIAALFICLAFMRVFGWSLLYAVFLFVMPYCFKHRFASPESPSR